ncbi:hypothetical protein GQ607_016049 [Colletotrichum asianum]|uniref:Uncharacterized protein n=1 Tax=Colletotrichum asianum TaxID=702518 RepID=A0A8H3VZT4_9PEZI|nr:hypothetical protein GQ607_016049 [Colletotrichum asianum]
MFPTIVLVAFFATVTNAKGACYVPNGIDRHSLSNIGDNEYDPCEKDGVSMCCNTHNKDRCQRSGLCWEPSSNVLWRGSCTDQTWESPGCLKLCISPNETGDCCENIGNDNIGNNNLGIHNIGNHGTNSDSLCVHICRGSW